MEAPPISSTILLLRLQACPTNKELGDEFVERYGSAFYGWCRQQDLKHHDAEEVTQEVFLRVSRSLATFVREKGSPRTWTYTILKNCLQDHYREAKKGRRPGALPDEFEKTLLDRKALQHLQDEMEREFPEELLALAEQRVRLRVKELTWQCYERYTKQGIPSAEVAKELGIPLAQVTKYALRVRTIVKDEVKKILKELGEPS